METINEKTHEFKTEFILKAGMEISGLSTASRGTLGAIVFKDGKPMILTNKHVITTDDPEQTERNREKLLVRVKEHDWDVAPELLKRIEEGEIPVFHPQYPRGDKRAKIVAFVSEAYDEYDAALCEIIIPLEQIDREIDADPIEPTEGRDVFKTGCETGLSIGNIKQVECNILIIEKIVSRYADSGAVFVESGTNKPVGLLFKVDSDYTYAYKMTTLAAKMGFSFKKTH